MGLASRVSIFLIKGYKYLISPFLGRSCRFDPSCSSYALEAFSKYGFFLGFKLSIKRIARCHPWGNHGYDPLPEINNNKRKTR